MPKSKVGVSSNQNQSNEEFSAQSCNNNVFRCPVCMHFFSASPVNLPLNLPCGHIICKQCLINSQTNNQTIKCPLDNTIHEATLNSLPQSKAILDNLPGPKPAPQTNFFCCDKHPMKKIKFICEYDNEAFCSDCLCDHSKQPHKISNFIPDKQKFIDEVKLISKRVNEKRSEINQKEKKLNDFKVTLCNRTKNEIAKLCDEVTKIINRINKTKELFEEKIRNLFKYQLEEIDEGKIFINKQLGDLETIENKIVEFNNDFMNNNSGSISYLSCVMNKNQIIHKWEQYVKKFSSIEMNSGSLGPEKIINDVVLPKIVYGGDKYAPEKNFFRFETENFLDDVQKKDNGGSNVVRCNFNTKANSNRNSSVKRGVSAGITKAGTNSGSSKERRPKFRKESDPTTKSGPRKFCIENPRECRGPILINDHFSSRLEDMNRRRSGSKYKDTVLITN